MCVCVSENSGISGNRGFCGQGGAIISLIIRSAVVDVGMIDWSLESWERDPGL